MHLPTYCIIDT